MNDSRGGALLFRKFKESLRIRTIRGRFFLLTTCVILIPMVLLSIIFYQIAAKKLGSNAMDHATASLKMEELYMDRVIKELSDLTNVILSDEEIQKILSNQSMDDFEYILNVDKVTKLMNVYTQTKPFITSYLIYAKHGNENKHFYRGSITDSVFFGSQHLLDPEMANRYYKQLLDHNSLLWINQDPFAGNKVSANSNRMIVGKLLKKTEGDYENLGFVMLEIDKAVFFQGLQFLNPTEKSQIFVLNEQGEMLYHMPQLNEGKETSAAQMLRKVHLTEAISKQKLSWEGKTYIGASMTNDRTGWKIINMIEYAKLFEDANEIGTITIKTFLFILLIGWLIALRLSNSISRPLNRLRSMMAVQHLTSTDNYKFNTSDEVGQIGAKFIRMTEENRQLNQQVYDALIKRKEAEIQVLQAQINPHFLYNTLEALNGYAISNNQPEMSDVIGAFGKFFRITLSKGNDLITVADEIEHVSAYVKVQQFRFKDKFEWISEVDEVMMSYFMPKLILQPLVENAIYHGMKDKTGIGMIMLTGELSDGVLRFQITDDGQGITKERLKEIMDSLSDVEQGEIYGLKNVNDRLRLRFGEQFGIQISGEARSYTTVSVTIPVISDNLQPIKHPTGGDDN